MFIVFTLIVFFLSFLNGTWIWFRFILFIFVVIALIIFSVILSILGPSKFKYRLEDWDDTTQYSKLDYDKEKWNVVIDCHSHTNHSDGKLTVEQSIKYHLSVGFNACVFTDHNSLKNLNEVMAMKEKYKDTFMVIPGLEYTTYRIHMCFLGITEWDCKNDIPNHPSDEDIKKAIEKVHRMGGLVVVCHYPWSTWGINPRMPDHPTREQMYSWGVDLIECANWEDDISLIDYASYEFAKTRPNIGYCSGTDMHEPYKAPLSSWTLLNAEKFTEEAIMKELKNHRTEVILKPEGLKYPIKHKSNIWFNFLRPLMMFGDKLQDLYLGGKLTNLDVSGNFLVWLFFYRVYNFRSFVIRYWITFWVA